LYVHEVKYEANIDDCTLNTTREQIMPCGTTRLLHGIICSRARDHPSCKAIVEEVAL
jgi:hypothetical protein